LPESLLRILEAPGTFIFGMHSSFHDELFLQNDVISVDLDNHCVTISADNGQRQKPISSECKLPKTLKNKLKQRLMQHVKVNKYKKQKLFDTFLAGDEDENEYFDAEAVQTQSIHFHLRHRQEMYQIAFVFYIYLL
jgi:hypothetical protein